MDEQARQKALGEVIRRLRTEQGLSTRTFAMMSNVNRSYLRLVENGEVSISISRLCRIADALGVKVRDLITF